MSPPCCEATLLDARCFMLNFAASWFFSFAVKMIAICVQLGKFCASCPAARQSTCLICSFGRVTLYLGTLSHVYSLFRV